MPANVKAVLFDYDGVIADTMTDNYQAWKHAFAEFSVIITDKEYYLLEGMSPAAVARELGTKNGLSECIIAQIPGKKAEYYRAHNSFRVYSLIPDFLNELKKRDIKLALVSGAARHRIEEMTPGELLSLFDVIVSVDDIIRSKPDPESYQKAIKLLKAESSEAVVIENAPLGVQSAKAAGCYCIALSTTLPKNALLNADMILTSHKELVAFFSKFK